MINKSFNNGIFVFFCKESDVTMLSFVLPSLFPLLFVARETKFVFWAAISGVSFTRAAKQTVETCLRNRPPPPLPLGQTVCAAVQCGERVNQGWRLDVIALNVTDWRGGVTAASLHLGFQLVKGQVFCIHVELNLESAVPLEWNICSNILSLGNNCL